MADRDAQFAQLAARRLDDVPGKGRRASKVFTINIPRRSPTSGRITLRCGGGTRTEIDATDPDLWVFSETATVGTATDTVYVAINRSDGARTATGVPAGLPELVVGATSTGSDVIPPRETRIFSNYVPPMADAGADGG